MSIPASIRALYRVIGNLIGKNIADRIKNDDNLDPNPETRKILASKLIETITKLRRELAGSRDFDNIAEIISVFLQENKFASKNQGIKLCAWILEAYLLLNQSSTACADITKPYALMPDRIFAAELIKQVKENSSDTEIEAKLEAIFRDFSANLVLTAHPTAGIQPDYVNHIKHMVETVQEIAQRVDPQDWDQFVQQDSAKALEIALADLLENISLSISHMVRAKPYNSEILTPIDESLNFLNNIEEAWEIVPSKVQTLEKELQKTFGKDFRLNSNFFRLHSWVARDIDGNPTVSADMHLRAILQERLHFLTKYRLELDNLWLSLSDDFTSDPNLPSKTFFRDQGFKDFYDNIVKASASFINKPHQAYRVVIEHGIIAKLEIIIDNLLSLQKVDISNIGLFFGFNVSEDIIKPLELIRANKENINTKEIDLLIRKARIFSDYGSWGHTRQGNDTLAKLSRYLTALWDKQINNKTFHVVMDPSLEPGLQTASFEALRQKIILQYGSDSGKTQQRLLQTYDLIALSELGAIRRQIISMNQSFEDMLNSLVIAKTTRAFVSATEAEMPWSRLEIVPLTEQISDLRNSYRVTIDALTNPAWHQYLIAQNGRFIKMRGPSDSGKQNGFVASQWEMFRSKQLDTIVVKIFNAYLKSNLNADSRELHAWRNIARETDISSFQEIPNQELSEKEVIALAIRDFDRFFAIEKETDIKAQLLQGRFYFDRSLWQRAQAEGIIEIKLINFDGWGEPVERGGGLEFENTVRCTQPIGSIPYYERTLQGGGAQQLASRLRTRQAIQDFIHGISALGLRSYEFNKEENSTDNLSAFYKNNFVMNPDFSATMNHLVLLIRSALRSEVFGLDLDDDNKVSNETALRIYFRHVIKSPLVYLDLFNIASRPTSRSGAQIKELLNSPEYGNSLDALAEKLPVENIVSILADIRAIPYAAMFSLLGGNHVSFYGFDKVLEDQTKIGSENKTIVEWLSYFYHNEDDSQETRLTKHIIDSLERGVITGDQDCYRKAHELIELSTNPEYKADKDILLNKLRNAQQTCINFIAKIKNYQVENPEQVRIEELMQNDHSARDLLIARRNDAAVPRIGIALSMREILANAKNSNLNPLDSKNIPVNLLDLLRKAFAAGASTFGNGCID